MKKKQDIPKVSIIAPIYNAQSGIRRLIERLDALTYPHLEFIVIDDASTDNTLSEVKRLTGEDSRFQIVHLSKNGGPGNARNQGVRYSSGEYIWFCDWDDDWEPTIIDQLVSLIKNSKDAIAVCSANRLDGKMRLIGPADTYTSDSMLTGSEALYNLVIGRNQGYLWNKLFPRGLVESIPFHDLPTHEDFHFLLRAYHASSHIYTSSSVLYYYVQREGSITRGISVNHSGVKACETLIDELSASSSIESTLNLAPLFRIRNLQTHAANSASRRNFTDFRRAKHALRKELGAKTLKLLSQLPNKTKLSIVAIVLLGNLYFPLHSIYTKVRKFLFSQFYASPLNSKRGLV